MRTFIAIKIPVEQKLKVVLRELKDALSFERIKWVDFHTLHLTLFFLGDTPAPVVDRIGNLFKEHLYGFSEFSISIKGLGVFGSKANPKVLWVGVEPNPELKLLERKVVELIEPLGYKPDARGFNPHITIGRIKSVGDTGLLDELVLEHETLLFQQSCIDEVILYKSELMPQGPRYTPIASQRLCK
ncbi:MAG: RNA 2',3'-cyclic phosphodiesterase [Tenuifilaceae bacterium]|jgi:2'-5' RNA ligase|nr:RNA 2',3'-cyclic phosphodiesterase [Tenuifilaceae bacterium]